MRYVDFDEVVALASERGCTVRRTTPVSLEMRGKAGSTAPCDAVDGKGDRWTTTAVFTACRDARLSPRSHARPGTVKVPKGLDQTQYGLREDLIAEALVADGVWSYRSGQRTVALEVLLRSEAAERGLQFADNKPAIRQAARAVVDAGLAELFMGPNGGWSRAWIRWLPAARISGTLDTEDEDAAASIGAPK